VELPRTGAAPLLALGALLLVGAGLGVRRMSHR
jgi:LPXTG-motif cell wall-anchored protein